MVLVWYVSLYSRSIQWHIHAGSWSLVNWWREGKTLPYIGCSWILMNAAVGHMDGSALMVIGVSAWYPDTHYHLLHFPCGTNLLCGGQFAAKVNLLCSDLFALKHWYRVPTTIAANLLHSSQSAVWTNLHWNIDETLPFTVYLLRGSICYVVTFLHLKIVRAFTHHHSVHYCVYFLICGPICCLGWICAQINLLHGDLFSLKHWCGCPHLHSLHMQQIYLTQRIVPRSEHNEPPESPLCNSYTTCHFPESTECINLCSTNFLR